MNHRKWILNVILPCVFHPLWLALILEGAMLASRREKHSMTKNKKDEKNGLTERKRFIRALTPRDLDSHITTPTSVQTYS